MSTKNTHKISVVGLGKLGAPLAAVMANAGHSVWGVDRNKTTVDKINAGIAPIQEPQLQEFLSKSSDRLCATTCFEEAITATDVTFIIVPTPSKDDGSFTNQYVLSAVQSVGEQIKGKDTYHMVVISSTVMPGSMNSEIRNTLEHASARTAGTEKLGLCYNPEFIALGNVINNMLQPDFLLIGESDPKAGRLLQDIHHTVCLNSPTYHRMNFVNAEITKISVNTYVTTKISYANMLAEMCEKLPGGDVDIVTDAVGSDSRIGKKYLQGAIGYGGPCFPRDNKAFAALADSLDSANDIAIATDKINDRQVERMLKTVQNYTETDSPVAVLGLAYKPDTPEIEKSQGILLCERLQALGYPVHAHDPQAAVNASNLLKESIMVSNSLSDTIKNAHTIIIVTPWETYKDINFFTRNRVMIDPWGKCCNARTASNITYIQMGRSANR